MADVKPWVVGAVAIAALGGLVLLSSKDDADEPELDPDDRPDPGQAREATPAMREAFGQELQARGVVNFTADELLAAGGGKFLLPPESLMPNLFKVIELAQRIRTKWGRPLKISSAYRPWDKGGAHTRAAAIDFDLPWSYRSEESEHDFRVLVARQWLGPEKEAFAGIGFYGQPTGRVHIDVHHPNGGKHQRRYWYAKHVKPIFDEITA